jgi:hypothetical protein
VVLVLGVAVPVVDVVHMVTVRHGDMATTGAVLVGVVGVGSVGSGRHGGSFFPLGHLSLPRVACTSTLILSRG